MRIYFAGVPGHLSYEEEIEYGVIFRLQSFVYDKKGEFAELHDQYKDTMLDSGAFTYAYGTAKKSSKNNLDWKSYVDAYIEYINTYKMEKFFELDIDSIIGLENVRRITKYIERKTGRQSIPVWHLSRGKQDFINMCKEYSQVSIGGIVGKEIKQNQHKYFPWFIETAHKYGAKIHGLGLSNIEKAVRYGFDSVDMTKWLDIRFGSIYYFDGRMMRDIPKPESSRVITKNAYLYQLAEWAKYQEYIYENTPEFNREDL